MCVCFFFFFWSFIEYLSATALSYKGKVHLKTKRASYLFVLVTMFHASVVFYFR